MSDAGDFQKYLDAYLGEVPGGPAGDLEMRRRLAVPFMDTTDADVRPDRLTDEQLDSWLGYAAWELWELIANRSTEGESGLIPRQEYETCSFVQQWATYPALLRAITAEVGVDGVIELGRVCRREVGTKLNVTRNWAIQFCPLLGRGISIKLGLEQPEDRRADVETIIQFGRRMQHGTWEGGCGLVSGRGFKSPTLEPELFARLMADVQPLADPEVRKTFRRFNATTELFGFLLHYDCRAGMADTGPYPLPDGDGFVIVRDHFLNETAYPWADVAAGQPYAVTEVLVFWPDAPIAVTINDISTTFTEPADYLQHLSAVATYARDTRETPMEDLRLLGPDELKDITQKASAATLALYSTLAAKDHEAKIHDGVMVYTREMMMPIAQQVGMWDGFVAQGFDELDDLTRRAWPILTGGAAMEVLPPVFLLGEGFPLLTGAPA